jgi:hypothetical protein
VLAVSRCCRWAERPRTPPRWASPRCGTWWCRARSAATRVYRYGALPVECRVCGHGHEQGSVLKLLNTATGENKTRIGRSARIFGWGIAHDSRRPPIIIPGGVACTDVYTHDAKSLGFVHRFQGPFSVALPAPARRRPPTQSGARSSPAGCRNNSTRADVRTRAARGVAPCGADLPFRKRGVWKDATSKADPVAAARSALEVSAGRASPASRGVWRVAKRNSARTHSPRARLQVVLQCAVAADDGVRGKAIRLVANKLFVLPALAAPVEQVSFSYRRLRIQGGQGCGSLGYRFTIQAYPLLIIRVC